MVKSLSQRFLNPDGNLNFQETMLPLLLVFRLIDDYDFFGKGFVY